MTRVIKDLPDEMDPVKLIENKMMKCPICGTPFNRDKYNRFSSDIRADAKGVHHKYRTWLNKYCWEQYYNLKCDNCGCHWDTGWYPTDHKMFEVPVYGDESAMRESINKMLEGLGLI